MELLIELNELARHAISTQVGGQIISNGRETPLFEVLQGQEAKNKKNLTGNLFFSLHDKVMVYAVPSAGLARSTEVQLRFQKEKKERKKKKHEEKDRKET